MHDRFRPGCTETVQTALSAEDFERHQAESIRCLFGERAFYVPSTIKEQSRRWCSWANFFAIPRSPLINVVPSRGDCMIFRENTFRCIRTIPVSHLRRWNSSLSYHVKVVLTRLLLEGFGTEDWFSRLRWVTTVAFYSARKGRSDQERWSIGCSQLSLLRRHVTLATRMAPNAKNHGEHGRGGWAPL